MKSWSIRAQMIAGVFALVGGLSVLFATQGFYGMGRLISIHRETVSEELARTIRARTSILLRAADLALEPILADERIRGAFARRDREALLKLLAPMWPALKEKGIAQFQFHVPPATSYLRMHDPKKFGDDLSFRATIVKANSEHKPVAGLEEGRGGFGLRVVRPVFDTDGSFLGTVEFGLDFGNKFLQDIKSDYRGDYFLYRFSDRDAKAWKSGSQILGSTAESDPIPLDHAPVSTEWADGKVVEYRSGNQLVVLVPVADYSGQYIGLVKAHLDLSAFDRERGILTLLFLATGIIGMALGAGSATLFVRRAFRPLERCTELTERMAQGDLTIGIEHTRSDEVGAILHSLDNMRTGLGGLLRRIANAITETTQAAKDLEVGTAEVTQAAQMVAKTMEHVASDSTHLNELTRKSRQAAGDLERSAIEVGSAADRTREESASVLAASRRAAEAARMSSEMIDRISSLMAHSAESVRVLGVSLESVREFAGSIQSISDEINLLSLNASIEAARAGEAGRGFAVVAQHVSRLADQSGQAVSDIHRTIEDILKEAELTSDAIIAGNKEMKEGSRGVREALNAIGTIESMIERVDSFVETITRAAGHQSSEASLVTKSMEQVSGLIEESVAATEEVAASMEEITGLMVSLKKESEHLSKMARDMGAEASIFRN